MISKNHHIQRQQQQQPILRDNNESTEKEIKNSEKIIKTVPFYYLRFNPIVSVSTLDAKKLLVFHSSPPSTTTSFFDYFNNRKKKTPVLWFKAVLESFMFLQETVLVLKKEGLWVNLSPEKIVFNKYNQPLIHNLSTLISFDDKNKQSLEKWKDYTSLYIPFEVYILQRKQGSCTSTQMEKWRQEYMEMFQERKEINKNQIIETECLTTHIETWDTCSLCLLFLKLLDSPPSSCKKENIYALQKKLKAYIHPDPEMRLRDYTPLDSMDFTDS